MTPRPSISPSPSSHSPPTCPHRPRSPPPRRPGERHLKQPPARLRVRHRRRTLRRRVLLPCALRAPPPPKDTSSGYTLSITGGYSGLSGFLADLSHDLGYTLIRSVRISQPDLTKPDLLRASVETEHFAFDVTAIKTVPIAGSPSNA